MKIEWTRTHFLGDFFRCCRLPRILTPLLSENSDFWQNYSYVLTPRSLAATSAT